MYTAPVRLESPTVATFLVDAGVDSVIGFEFLLGQNKPTARRYCNLVLVDVCVVVPCPAPQDITEVEFRLSNDPCWDNILVSKNSVDNPGHADIQLNDDDACIGIIIRFARNELVGAPARLGYRLYGKASDDTIFLISYGSLYVRQ